MFKQRKKRRSREFKNLNKVIDLEQAREERRNRRKEIVQKRQSKDRPNEKEELSERKIVKRNRKRLIYMGILLGIIAVIGVSAFHVISLQNEYRDIVAQNKELKDKRTELNEELGKVNDLEYIEQQAREQLKMVKPGEVLYILPDENSTGAAVSTKPAVTDTLPGSGGGTTQDNTVPAEEDIL
ncbi:FtsB family cell division protein [Clostridium aminobutyricum]|uniref:Septum formation initiator family protein n=1 Tax=Clostridium aminobutyricum TaxID=33953 RepID=A0A939IKB7_CLOAM|nr:septum formation initiator family protein [Clostridium aminobutyricum]MBN7774478.1 septum formation initiator family protein [Clostridium aminobutyricum]